MEAVNANVQSGFLEFKIPEQMVSTIVESELFYEFKHNFTIEDNGNITLKIYCSSPNLIPNLVKLIAQTNLINYLVSK